MFYGSLHEKKHHLPKRLPPAIAREVSLSSGMISFITTRKTGTSLKKPNKQTNIFSEGTDNISAGETEVKERHTESEAKYDELTHLFCQRCTTVPLK